jgi:hypothetical protein
MSRCAEKIIQDLAPRSGREKNHGAEAQTKWPDFLWPRGRVAISVFFVEGEVKANPFTGA